MNTSTCSPLFYIRVRTDMYAGLLISRIFVSTSAFCSVITTLYFRRKIVRFSRSTDPPFRFNQVAPKISGSIWPGTTYASIWSWKPSRLIGHQATRVIIWLLRLVTPSRARGFILIVSSRCLCISCSEIITIEV